MAQPDKGPREPRHPSTTRKRATTKKPARRSKKVATPDPPEEEFEQPVEWPHEWMGQFLVALSAIPNVTAAAQAAGITRQWANRSRLRNPEFDKACVEAIQQADELLERYAWQMSTTGVSYSTTVTKVVTKRGHETQRETTTTTGRLVSPSMAQFLLRARKPKVYDRDKRIQLTGDGGGPIQVDLQVRLDEARSKFKARLDGIRAAGPAGELASGSS